MHRAIVALLFCFLAFFEGMSVYYIEVSQVLFFGHYTPEKMEIHLSYVRPFTGAITFSIIVNLTYAAHAILFKPSFALTRKKDWFIYFWLPLANNFIAFYAVSRITFVMC